MQKDNIEFYIKHRRFVEDIKSYHRVINEEFRWIIKEVWGYTLKCQLFSIGMIPLKSNTEGILFNGSNEISFECDEIRAEIGDDYH